MWEKRFISNVPTINYWTSVRDCLPLRPWSATGDWLLTLNACDEICPWFFAFGHTNYACWVPVFLRDMARLPETHPSVHEALMAGKFVVQCCNKKFSLMALDQSQEHSIQFLKEDSGAKGQYAQQESKEVIELSKPEVLRDTDEFECTCFPASTPNDSLEHPESSVAEQKKFIKHLMLYVIL